MKTKTENQFLWRIWGAELDPLYIEATDFDRAIGEARKIHKRYCAGQIVAASCN